MQSCKLGKSFLSCNPSKNPEVNANANDNFESFNGYSLICKNWLFDSVSGSG